MESVHLFNHRCQRLILGLFRGGYGHSSLRWRDSFRTFGFLVFWATLVLLKWQQNHVVCIVNLLIVIYFYVIAKVVE